MIWEYRNKLKEVGTKDEVFLIWVPGHSGIKGNEEANTLAKEGARISFIGPEPFCGIGKCIYKKEFLEKEKAEREKLCFLTGHCCLRRHMLRMGLSDTDECRFCGEEEETPVHLVMECFGIATIRRECLGRETCKSEELASLKLSQILDFIRSRKLEGEL